MPLVKAFNFDLLVLYLFKIFNFMTYQNRSHLLRKLNFKTILVKYIFKTQEHYPAYHNA